MGKRISFRGLMAISLMAFAVIAVIRSIDCGEPTIGFEAMFPFVAPVYWCVRQELYPKNKESGTKTANLKPREHYKGV